ncbi:MAG: DUF2284 domain-containing protein [Bacteroidales bacterium]
MECVYVKVDVERYIREYRDVERFAEYCKVCPVYASSWSCPPYHNSQELTDKISSYKYAYIFAYKVAIDDDTRFKASSIEERTSLTYKILGPVRDFLDNLFYEMEGRLTTGSLAFFSGRCMRCAPNDCTRISGVGCVKPDEMRQSLESLGFDLTRTMSELLDIELKWSTDNSLPEYLMAIPAIFTMDELSEQELGLLRKTEIEDEISI